MKTYLFSCALVTAILFNLGCQNKPADDAASADSNQSMSGEECISSPKYSISIDSVRKDTSRYLQTMKKFTTLMGREGSTVPLDFPVRAFTISSIDLLEAMGLPFDEKKLKPKYNNVRIYIGMDKDSRFKLFFTPVEDADLSANPPKAGRDHILCKKINDNTAGGTQGYLLDFASPCPNTCPN